MPGEPGMLFLRKTRAIHQLSTWQFNNIARLLPLSCLHTQACPPGTQHQCKKAVVKWVKVLSPYLSMQITKWKSLN